MTEGQNRRYFRLTKEFGKQTGVSVMLSTSFNENEPLVCKTEEALGLVPRLVNSIH
jgi:carbamoyltransferase